MIDLSQAVLVGSGNERLCYRHPMDPSKVIKVTRPRFADSRVVFRNQNRIDRYYLARLERRGVPARHLLRQYGLVPTSLGEGLVLDCVIDADGSIASDVATLLRNGRVTVSEIRQMLADLYVHFHLHGVVMVDISLGNLAGRQCEGRWEAVVIDGLGSRHVDPRLWLRANCLWLARRKLRKQWEKWELELDKVLGSG